ncbi:hypothetical protein OIU74_009641 [Salix koriyanagi]|uniref:Uncharacterized protein n=1 Tax=Salix koriyanagi TaxID=2511006 RepID=A0A9Q0TT49_9ROSI|nr:hypothetical protein OIU74_009641 [Salix koriyanagi]
MRRLAYEADLFSDRLTQLYGKRIPHWLGARLFCFQVNDSMVSDICIDWKQIIGIDELVKQSFTAMELVLFLAGALLPLLLILFFKPLSAILREKANDHSSCEAARNQIS